MRKLLISMSLTYLLIDCCFNLLLPAMLAVVVILQDDSHRNFSPEAQTWREAMQLINDIRIQFVLAFNLQMVYFYYKLALSNTTSTGVPEVLQETEEANIETSLLMTDPDVFPRDARLSDPGGQDSSRLQL